MATSVELQARTLKGRVEAYERRLIMVALERAGGNQHRAALALGVRPTTLNEKLKRLGIGVVRHVVDLERPDPEERRRVRDELRRLGIGLERAIEDEPRWPELAADAFSRDQIVGARPRRARMRSTTSPTTLLGVEAPAVRPTVTGPSGSQAAVAGLVVRAHRPVADRPASIRSAALMW